MINYFKQNLVLTGLLFLMPLMFHGCLAHRDVTVRYYTLEYPQDADIELLANTAPVERSLLVNTVEIYPAFATNQIAIREDTHEIRYFSFNQWAVRPEQSLTALLTDFLKRSNIFESVYSPLAYIEPDLVLETTIYNLEIIEEGRNFNSRLSLEYRLINSRDGQVLHSHRADRKEALEDNNLNLFAASITSIFIGELGNFMYLALDDLR